MTAAGDQPQSGEQPQRFDYTPRRVKAIGRGYSLFVSILKFSLPAAALVIVIILGVRLSSRALKTTDIAALPAAEKTTPGQIELMKPKYEGTDDQGRTYTITADKAVRALSAPDAVVFENPLADITLGNKGWLALKGKTGIFDHAKEMLTMNDGVSVFHDSGYEMTVRNLNVNLKDKTAETKEPVTAQGPMGTLTARNMKVLNQGNLVVFGGPATMTIFNASGFKLSGNKRG